MLDERQRMAREIHDTIAQGLTGIVTQLEAAEQARDRPEDRDRHIDERRAAWRARAWPRRAARSRHRCPRALETATLPDALADGRREWSELNGVPVEVTVDRRRPSPLHPEIEVALLRTAQEALANVAKHAGATARLADAVVHGRRRDARRPRRRRRVRASDDRRRAERGPASG